METEFRDNDLLEDLELFTVPDQTNPLHVLQQAIAAMPVVDAEKVEAIRKKLLNGELGILGNEADRLACAQRIAQAIMQENLPTESTGSDVLANDQ